MTFPWGPQVSYIRVQRLHFHSQLTGLACSTYFILTFCLRVNVGLDLQAGLVSPQTGPNPEVCTLSLLSHSLLCPRDFNGNFSWVVTAGFVPFPFQSQAYSGIVGGPTITPQECFKRIIFVSLCHIDFCFSVAARSSSRADRLNSSRREGKCFSTGETLGKVSERELCSEISSSLLVICLLRPTTVD